MDASIIIRTKNEAECIGETLRRIHEQKFSGSYEVIVVDSGSTDATVEIASANNAKIITIPQVDFTYGRSLNLGAQHAKAENIVNLSAHAIPTTPMWLTALISAFDEPAVVAAYGKQIANPSRNPFEAMKNERFFGDKPMVFSTYNKKLLHELHFSNSNSAIRKSAWESFKFHEEVGWAEDILWEKQVLEAGMSIAYVPEAAVYHTHEAHLSRAYSSSRDCAFALAMMDGKSRSTFMLVYDVGVFLGLMPGSIFQNTWYTLRNRYLTYVKVAPFYVMATFIGWLAGRIQYRLTK